MKYKLLGRSGVRVSEIALGTMTFGEEWGYGANKVESQKIFRTYIEAGGNFIDTACRYTEGTSEIFLGDFIQESKFRQQLVLATKYSLITKVGNGINESGNHKKNMVQTVEGSLKRLQTDFIDVLYLHAWDFTTQIEEVMRGLDDLVRQGKVLYVAVSDTPAWIVSRANAIAELRAWSPFVALQVEYSLIQRTVERELIPMATALDLAIIGWAPIAGGALTGKYLEVTNETKRLKEGSLRLNERSIAIAKEVVRIALQLNCKPAQVAIAWVRQQGNVIIPIVGARNAEQLAENLQSAEIILTQSQLMDLHEVSKIELGFPHEFLKADYISDILFGGQLQNLNQHRKGF